MNRVLKEHGWGGLLGAYRIMLFIDNLVDGGMRRPDTALLENILNNLFIRRHISFWFRALISRSAPIFWDEQ